MKPLIIITFFIVSSFSTARPTPVFSPGRPFSPGVPAGVKSTTPLIQAVLENQLPLITQLIRGGAEINAKDALGRTAADYAVLHNNLPVLELVIAAGADANLVDNDADLNSKNKRGYSAALRLAARSGHTELVKLFINNGVDIFAGRGEKALDVEKMMKSEARLAPTEIVATSASLPSAESHALLPVEEETFAHAIGQYLSVRVKVITESIRSCIACLRDKLTSYTATLEDSFQPVEEEIARTLAATESIGEAIILDVTTEEIKQLISQGANVERRDENGRTALMLAALLGKWREISLLLDAGAEVNAQDNDGNTALHLALEVGHHETVALLRSRGADASTENNAGITTLALAQESEDKVLLELVQIERPEQGSRQAQRDTANKLLQRAAAHDSHSQPQTEDEQKLLD